MLDTDWFERDDVDRFIEILLKLGFDCAIKDVAGRPTLIIWKLKTEEQIFVPQDNIKNRTL